MGDFKYPRDFGFSGSADHAERRVPVKSHTRQRFQKGGAVRKDRPLTATEHEAIDRENTGNRVRELKRDPKTGGLVTAPKQSRRGAALHRQERALGLKKGGFVKRKNC